jgi:hypothetical protein
MSAPVILTDAGFRSLNPCLDTWFETSGSAPFNSCCCSLPDDFGSPRVQAGLACDYVVPIALRPEARPWAGSGWRAVKAQHKNATITLTHGNIRRQAILEDIIEDD